MGLLLWLGSGAALGAFAAYVQITNNRERWGDKQRTHVVVMAMLCSALGPLAIMFVFFCHAISKDGPL